MKTFVVFFAATIFIAASLVAKPIPSLREKREQEINKNIQKDKSIANGNASSKTVFIETKQEKTQRDNKPLEKTIRADKIGKEPVLTPTPVAKKRKNTHFREWP